MFPVRWCTMTSPLPNGLRPAEFAGPADTLGRWGETLVH